jgi:hypothetical protein
MKKADVLEFPSTLHLARAGDDCVLHFSKTSGFQSIVLSYDAAFELAVKLAKFIHLCDEAMGGESEPNVRPPLELIAH